MRFQGNVRIGSCRANPAGRLGIAVVTSSYADRKKLNDGIALRRDDQDGSVMLNDFIAGLPNSDKIFQNIRSADDLVVEIRGWV